MCYSSVITFWEHSLHWYLFPILIKLLHNEWLVHKVYAHS